eukprot:45184_1
MAYCGFSDSSSEEEDDDIHTQTTPNQPTKDDEWINPILKPADKPKEQTQTTSNQAKRPRFNHYLQPKSLQDMKDDIYSTSNDTNPHAPPPPLQSLSDSTTLAYNHNKQKYKVQYKHRTTLTKQESIPKSRHPWQQSPTITGVSAQVSIGIKTTEPPHFRPASIKLSRVIHLLRNVEYKPEEFVAIRMKLKNPMMTVTMFSNGKLTTQGGKSQYSCTVALRKVARMLQQLDDYKDQIQHITQPSFYGVQANAHLGHRVDLQKMSEGFPRRVEYSTDIESAYLKFREPLKYGDKGSCHVYHRGRVTILGVASVKSCILWLEDMYDHCKDYFMDEDMRN